MGCTHSRGCAPSSTLPFPRFEAIDKAAIPLTAEQKKIVRETWEIIKPNKKEIGVNVYMRFLNMNPNLKTLFSEFKDIPIEKINKSNAHPKRLMAAIENSVTALDDCETFTSYMLEMGRRHARQNLRPSKSHLRDLRDAFIYSIKPFLDENWRTETEESWILLFDFMTSMMTKGYGSKS